VIGMEGEFLMALSLMKVLMAGRWQKTLPVSLEVELGQLVTSPFFGPIYR
jgi:hypothetical protein